MSATQPNSAKGANCTDWPRPDMSVLHLHRHPAPAMPLDVFGPWAPWIVASSEGTSAPVDYVACSLLAVASLMLGNARWVAPWETWQEPPALWMALVGEPSSGKSPAIAHATAPLPQIEADFAADYEHALRQWTTSMEAAKCERAKWEKEVEEAVKAGREVPLMPLSAAEPERPQRPRLYTSDATLEKVCELIAGNRRGLLVLRDELSGFIGSFDRYGTGTSERAFWLESYGGRPYIQDRVKLTTPRHIPNLTVGILGGIQPDKLSAILKGDDDGLSARFLYAWPDRVPPTRPRKVPDDRAALAAYGRIHGIQMHAGENGIATPVVLPLTDEAADVFDSWRLDHDHRSSDVHGMLKGHYGKYPGMLLRLALVLEHLWWSMRANCDQPMAVSSTAVHAASRLLDVYFRPMAERAYGDAGLPESNRNAAIIAKSIFKEHKRMVNAGQIRRHWKSGNISSAQVGAAIEVLESADWLFDRSFREGGTPGRKQSNYEVNPRIWEEPA